jgi:hypothetical protein
MNLVVMNLGKSNPTRTGLVLVLFISFFVNACAPKPQSISRPVVIPISGPNKDDVDLKVNGRQSIAKVRWADDISPEDMFNLVENLLFIQSELNADGTSDTARNFVNQLPIEKSKIIDSPYTAFMGNRAQKMAKESLAKVLPELRAIPERIRHLLRKIDTRANASEKITLYEAGHRIFIYLREVDRVIRRSDIMTEVVDAIHEQISELLKLEPLLGPAARELENAKNLADAIRGVDRIAKEFGFQIPPKSAAQLNGGRELADRLDRITDARSALNALVSVWMILTPAERANEFRAVSPDLYDYLDGMDESELDCLRTDGCLSIPQWVARTLVIQPKIEEFGVMKIRNLLNIKGADEVRKQVLEAILEELRTAPDTVYDKVKEGIAKEVGPIIRMKDRFAQEMRLRLDKWAQTHFEATGPGVSKIQMTRAQLSVDRSGNVKVNWSKTPAESFEATAAYTSLTPYLWEAPAVEPSLARGLILAQADSLVGLYQSKNPAPLEAPQLTAKAFAEYVRGLARQAFAFREWEPSVFENLVGSVTAKDLFPEIKTSALDTPLYPKSAFYALSFASISKLLKSLTGPKTQMFFVDQENKVYRGNFKFPEGKVPAVMAGIADRKGNDLADTVRAEDVARILIAVCDVLQATKGVENSTSDILIQPGEDGKIPRDEIVKSREDIKLLILVLANYLSHQFRSGGELIRHELVIATQKPTRALNTVLDQALALRALVAASDAIGKDIYYWEAEDLLYSMNKRLYRRDLGFYAIPGQSSLDPLTVLETVRALEAVEPHLFGVSRTQIEHVVEPWRNYIESWNLTGS